MLGCFLKSFDFYHWFFLSAATFFEKRLTYIYSKLIPKLLCWTVIGHCVTFQETY